MTNKRSFPSIRPTQRSYSPGTFPSTNFESLDGTKTHIRYGNRRVNATLSLGFLNITDAQAFEILQNYEDVNSDWDYVTFDQDSGLAGVGGDGHTSKSGALENLAGYIDEAPSGLKWRYSGPPTVTSTFRGRSNVSCSFVACLDSP
tara:strand:- start:388 stop:825 length:438 start_codon:yes stop_codon:yes gene_type:complete